MRYLTLPRRRNIGVKTEQLRYGRTHGGFTVFFRSMQLYKLQTGYARGGLPGALGPIVGYQVTVDDADGIEVYHVELRDRVDANEHFARVMDHVLDFVPQVTS